MPESQPLDKKTQQQHIDAYGGSEAGTLRRCSAILSSGATV